MSLDEKALNKILPQDALCKLEVQDRRILYIKPEKASPRWGHVFIERAKAYQTCIDKAGEILENILNKMVLDRQVRGLLLLNPWNLTEQFLDCLQNQNKSVSNKEGLLEPISIRDDPPHLTSLKLGVLDYDRMSSLIYEHPLGEKRKENLRHALSAWTIVLFKNLAFMTHITDDSAREEVIMKISTSLRRDKAGEALESVDYPFEWMNKTLTKLRNCGFLTEVDADLPVFESNRDVLDLWCRGMILELYVKKVLERKLRGLDVILGGLVISYPIINPEIKALKEYDKFQGYHEIDLMATYQDNIYLIECKNMPVYPSNPARQYNEVMHFIGKASCIEKYTSLPTKKIMIMTSDLHKNMAWLRNIDNLYVCDRESILNNLRDLVGWIESIND